MQSRLHPIDPADAVLPLSLQAGEGLRDGSIPAVYLRIEVDLDRGPVWYVLTPDIARQLAAQLVSCAATADARRGGPPRAQRRP